MIVGHVWAVRCLAGPDREERLLFVLRSIALGEDWCSIVLRPVGQAVRPGRAVLFGGSGVRPFSLFIRDGKARFDRDIRLPEHLRGLGLGIYFLSTLVRLAVLLGHGGARVRALHLVGRDQSPLREAFYRSMRFQLRLWPDGTGWARVATLCDLRSDYDHSKISEELLPAQSAYPLGM